MKVHVPGTCSWRGDESRRVDFAIAMQGQSGGGRPLTGPKTIVLKQVYATTPNKLLLISSLDVATSALLRTRADILEQEALLYATTIRMDCVSFTLRRHKNIQHTEKYE